MPSINGKLATVRIIAIGLLMGSVVTGGVVLGYQLMAPAVPMVWQPNLLGLIFLGVGLLVLMNSFIVPRIARAFQLRSQVDPHLERANHEMTPDALNAALAVYQSVTLITLAMTEGSVVIGCLAFAVAGWYGNLAAASLALIALLFRFPTRAGIDSFLRNALSGHG
ncbi:MAG: hypothetical protein AAFP90_04230 [Planctomycetota bacterium]